MRVQILLAVAFLCGSLAFAQTMPRHREFGARSGKIVLGAPYSADVNSTSVKTLADGNSIQRTTVGHVARDAQGRTYTQETITGLWGQSGSKTVTFISDPVAGYSYSLNAEDKTAIRRELHAHAASESSRPERPNVASVDLGAQTLNGIAVQGKKVTHTIPAGEMGNVMPIVSTSETWFSPELQVVISNKRTDPREGTSTYTLTNIQRTGPAATVFQVPSDYTTKDAPSFRR